MSEKCYFISDLHLGSSAEPKTFVLLKFLKSFRSRDQITHLFLLGDIFDMWLAGHDHYVQKYAAVVEEFKRLRDLGVQIHYFEGNHDMYLEHFFEKKLGIKVYKGPAVLTINGLRLRLEHGDQMDPSDMGYKMLRWFWRTPLLKWLAPRFPEWLIVWIGESLSTASRTYNSSEARALSEERARKMIREHAYRVWSEDTFDIILSGHVHVSEDSTFVPDAKRATLGHPDTFAPVRVVNLGSWFDQPRAFYLNGQRGEFVELG